MFQGVYMNNVHLIPGPKYSREAKELLKRYSVDQIDLMSHDEIKQLLEDIKHELLFEDAKKKA